MSSVFFFFNDTATTEIYTLSLHDALPILSPQGSPSSCIGRAGPSSTSTRTTRPRPNHSRRIPLRGRRTSSKNAARLSDRKSTRLNSSHLVISYAVFCLKKKIRHEIRMEFRLRERQGGVAHDGPDRHRE